MPEPSKNRNNTPELTFTSVGGYRGIDSQLGPEDVGFTPNNGIVSTAEIGRLFTTSSGVLALFNPCIRVTSDGEHRTVPCLLDGLASLQRPLVVGNFGCGGATDVPLLQELLNSRLNSGEATIENFDLSPEVVKRVKDGSHPHFASLLFERELDGLVLPPSFYYSHNSYDRTFFELVVRKLPQFFDRIGDAHSAEQCRTSAESGYLFQPSVAASIGVEVGDVARIQRPNHHFGLILCYNVVPYLTPERGHSAFCEIERVLCEGGILLSDGVIFQKAKGNLVLLSGLEDRSQSQGFGQPGVLMEGLYPTYFDGTRYVPYSLRAFRGNGQRGPKIEPGYCFIDLMRPPSIDDDGEMYDL